MLAHTPDELDPPTALSSEVRPHTSAPRPKQHHHIRIITLNLGANGVTQRQRQRQNRNTPALSRRRPCGLLQALLVRLGL